MRETNECLCLRCGALRSRNAILNDKYLRNVHFDNFSLTLSLSVSHSLSICSISLPLPPWFPMCYCPFFGNEFGWQIIKLFPKSSSTLSAPTYVYRKYRLNTKKLMLAAVQSPTCYDPGEYSRYASSTIDLTRNCQLGLFIDFLARRFINTLPWEGRR